MCIYAELKPKPKNKCAFGSLKNIGNFFYLRKYGLYDSRSNSFTNFPFYAFLNLNIYTRLFFFQKPTKWLLMVLTK